jgi:hypothetical protein
MAAGNALGDVGRNRYSACYGEQVRLLPSPKGRFNSGSVVEAVGDEGQVQFLLIRVSAKKTAAY